MNDFLSTIPPDPDPARNQGDTPLGRAASGAIKAGYTRHEIKHVKSAPAEECVLEFENATDVKPEATEWLWDQKLPLGCLIIFSGNPDCGKSCVTIDTVARLTTGRDWADGTKNPHLPSKVLMLIAEDDISKTVVPRLIAAGADLTYVQFLKRVKIHNNANRKERRFALNVDLAMLRVKLTDDADIRLIIADPITGYFGDVSMNKEQEIRDILEPLKQLCEDCKITFLGIGHFNKRTDVDAMQKVSGAVAMTGVPRAVWAFGKDPDKPGEYLMMLVKGNLAKDKTGVRYTIMEKMIDVDGHQTGVPRIEWLGRCNQSVEDLVARKDPEATKYTKAIRWLREFLKDATRLQTDVEDEALKQGIGMRTLNAAKKEAGVVSVREKGHWCWRLETIASSPEVGGPNETAVNF